MTFPIIRSSFKNTIPTIMLVTGSNRENNDVYFAPSKREPYCNNPKAAILPKDKIKNKTNSCKVNVKEIDFVNRFMISIRILIHNEI